MSSNALRRRSILPAFKSRNYRLFFAGQGLSLIGTWMTQIATIWLVYHLTNSAFWLGAAGFASQIPSFVLVPFGGVLGDRWDRHKTLIVTQILAMSQSLMLAFLALTESIQLWQIIALALFQGFINAFDAPTRQAFVSEIVEQKSDLPNAIALNSSMFNGARLVGPAIAGFVIASVGAGYCFLIDGLSYVAVIVALLAMRVEPRSNRSIEPVSIRGVFQQLQEGVTYAYKSAPIRALLLLMALTSLMGMQYTVLLPIFSTEVLRGNANTLGVLMAASGVGALIAGVYLALRKSIVGLGNFICVAPALMGTGLIVFAQSRILWLSALMMVLVGFGFLMQFASSNTVLQTIVEDDKRGRVMSLYILAFMGVMPFGSLFAGILATRIGASATLIISGSCLMIGSVWFFRQLPALKRIVRSIYSKIGVV